MGTSSEHKHPYEAFLHTENWAVLDRAVTELVKNRDLRETTAHEYVVGYLCQALERVPQAKPGEQEHLRATLRAFRELMQGATPKDRDLEAELLAERREEAARE